MIKSRTIVASLCHSCFVLLSSFVIRHSDDVFIRRAVWPVRSRFPALARLIFSGHSFGRPRKARRACRKFPEALVRANESVVRPASLVELSNAQFFPTLAPLVRFQAPPAMVQSLLRE